MQYIKEWCANIPTTTKFLRVEKCNDQTLLAEDIFRSVVNTLSKMLLLKQKKDLKKSVQKPLTGCHWESVHFYTCNKF